MTCAIEPKYYRLARNAFRQLYNRPMFIPFAGLKRLQPAILCVTNGAL
jgi:hypothetical protein